MPSVHRNALKKLLQSITQRINQDEASLLNTIGDDERDKLIEEIADLHARQKELMDALRGDDGSD